MSTLLYRLGRFSFRRWWAVLAAWLLVLTALVVTIGIGGIQLKNDFNMPGTESQAGLDALKQRFPQASGSSVQVVFEVPEGQSVTDEANQSAIQGVLDDFADVPDVSMVSPVYGDDAKNSISENQRFARTSIQFDVALAGETAKDRDAQLEKAAAAVPAGSGVEVTLGQLGFGGEDLISIGPFEAIGVLIAFLVMALTFTSLLAALMPLGTALLGVGVSVACIGVTALITDISTFTPTIAFMLGLAVGFDYALFVGSRYRHELANGAGKEEAAGRAIGTAGSAVVFAGLTVIIALCGLAVVNIPILTAMGVCAAVAVAVAVLVALTVLPALFRVFGERLRPMEGSRAYKRETTDPDHGHTIGSRWVKVVTKVPILTVIVVVGIGALMAIPAMKLDYALPDAGSEPETSAARQAYDKIAEGFGPGFNSPLIVTADIIGSDDPMTAIEDLQRDIAALPGVAAVPIATPNATVDTAMLQVVSKEGQTSPATKQLVADIRSHAAGWEKDLGISSIMVTGMTAMTIDVSTQMSNATLPFGIVVIGLSIILLMIVFRSVFVPIKAALGYLLSVVTAFGATYLVFERGYLADVVNVAHVGPIVSFLPIMLMGVLFGLSMDYEMFLVSRMHEEYQHRKDARRAITVGYTAGVRVVAAAAVIMISVFVTFVPHGSTYVQPIAFGLAVGVFFDAFLVRMTLVPAVMKLLGDKAWWLPRWLARLLPNLDVEGQGLERQLENEAWQQEHGAVLVRTMALAPRLTAERTGPAATPLTAVVRPDQITAIRGDAAERQALLLALAGRREVVSGSAIVLGHSLTDQAGAVRRQVAFVPQFVDFGDQHVAGYLDGRLLGRSFLGGRRRRMADTALAQANSFLASAAPGGSPFDRSITPAMPMRELSVEDRQLLDLCVASLERPALYLIDLGASSGAGGLWQRIDQLAADGAGVIVGIAPHAEVPTEHVIDMHQTEREGALS